MNNCCYCGEEGADPDTIEHSECAAEYERRKGECICTHCGKNDAAGPAEIRCESCTAHSFYLGYPMGAVS